MNDTDRAEVLGDRTGGMRMVLTFAPGGTVAPPLPGTAPPTHPARPPSDQPAATAAEKTAAVRALIAAHPEGRLSLPTHRGAPADLRGLTLPEENLRLADLQGTDLRGADLRGASLGAANLDHALLEEANLHGADLAGATLRGAKLDEADLGDALLEEANLGGASLRFADLRAAALDGADLRAADLWGAVLDGAILAGADLRNASLGEGSVRDADLGAANLRDATLRKVDLRGSKLRGADLRGAVLSGCDLGGVVLAEAQLQALDLSSCTLSGVHWGGAWLDKTRLRRSQLGERIGEEVAGQHAAAALGYLALERNFVDLGDPEAAGWAYSRRRRMEKLATRDRARDAAHSGAWLAVVRGWAGYVTAQLAEWVCDYGESIPRVLYSLLAVFVSFLVLYGLTGTVLHVDTLGGSRSRYITRDPRDLAIFSLYAITTSGSPAVGLLPRSEAVQLFIGIEAFLGIFLTGLLGFVAGNRIRR